ncbi:MAG: CBS domain-containing protein, partial [Bacteroidia bacterium]|nr:CBS domain-containing protein [Bacteroidia bacterium]
PVSSKMDFKDAKSNFFNAARYGMSTQFIWNNKPIPSHELLLDVFLPMAYKGLYSVGVSPKDAEHYLTIIENRIKGYTGSEWMTSSYRNLLKSMKPFEAAQTLTAKIYDKQEKNYPVSSWRLISARTESVVKAEKKVEHIMSTDIFTVYEKDSVELVMKIMQWKNIHHMPVINQDKRVVGLLKWIDVEGIKDDFEKLKSAVGDVMQRDFVAVRQGDTVEYAIGLMEKHQTTCLPVLRDDQLMGIITSKDLN